MKAEWENRTQRESRIGIGRRVDLVGFFGKLTVLTFRLLLHNYLCNSLLWNLNI